MPFRFGLGDNHHAWFYQAPVQCDLRFGFVNRSGNLLKGSVRIRGQDIAKIVSKRTVGNQGNLMSLTKGEQRTLDSSVHDTVPHLVRNEPVPFQRGLRLKKFRQSEIADAKKAYFALVDQVFHRGHRLRDGHRSVWIMQLIKVDSVDPQPQQACFGALNHLIVLEVVGFGSYENLIPDSTDRTAHNLFILVKLSCIDEGGSR